jgi:hypothetical protein
VTSGARFRPGINYSVAIQRPLFDNPCTFNALTELKLIQGHAYDFKRTTIALRFPAANAAPAAGAGSHP